MADSIMSIIGDLATKIFKKSTFVHEFYVHKNRLKMCFGIKIKHLFSAIISVKSREKVTILTFNLNGYKYRLYLATGKVLTAIRVALLYIKGRLTKDTRLMRDLHAVTLSKKEYRKLKLNKKKALKAVETRAEVAKTKKEKDEASGPLVIKFGYTGESPKFDDAVAATV